MGATTPSRLGVWRSDGPDGLGFNFSPFKNGINNFIYFINRYECHIIPKKFNIHHE